MAARRYEALVIGAGAGGLTAAALLARGGCRTLLVEARERVGGRASSVTEDGFTINTGAIAVEYGGLLEQVFDAVGAPFQIRIPEPATLFRLGERDVSLSGPIALLVNGALKRGASLLRGEDDGTTVRQWLEGYTRNETVHGIFRNLCAAIFAVNSDEMAVHAFMTYFLQKGAFRDFGFSPTGTLGLMRGLADAVTRSGGEVWTEAPVSLIHARDGFVEGATVVRENGEEKVEADVVVSNAGPRATVELCGVEHFPREYLTRIERDLQPTANIVFNIASRAELMQAPGIVTFARTRRLCNIANLTATCPELAPTGWNLYVAYGVPVPAVGRFDERAEVEAVRADLVEHLPGFESEARVLSVKVMKDDWPAQRSVAGRDLERETPLHNLFNVGDGVREYASGGVQACAETGKLVAEQILRGR